MRRARTRRNLLLLAAIMGLTIASASCDGGGGTGPGDDDPSLSGRWTFTHPEFGQVVDLTLTETNNGSVAGSGTIKSNGNQQVTVTGLHDHPDVSLNMTSQFCTAGFTGQFTNDNTITGTNVSPNECRVGAWTLKRQ